MALALGTQVIHSDIYVEYIKESRNKLRSLRGATCWKGMVTLLTPQVAARLVMRG